LVLLNSGPDEPFSGLPIDPAALANSETTGQVMQFRVVELTDQGVAGQIPASLPGLEPLTPNAPARYLTLYEESFMPVDIPVEAMLGTVADGPLDWHHPVTENPKLGDTEIWNLVNLTMDAHPIHLHLVRFRVLERVPLRAMEFGEQFNAHHHEKRPGEPPDPEDFVSGEPLAPEAWEQGFKDTVIAFPDQITRIAATFDIAGRFVWHCHILEHEDNEMMRPYDVIEP
jgi:FtsP/CotA-like multicopper oxidase with cupredoxin domain